jgi:hypothetical protein
MTADRENDPDCKPHWISSSHEANKGQKETGTRKGGAHSHSSASAHIFGELKTCDLVFDTIWQPNSVTSSTIHNTQQAKDQILHTNVELVKTMFRKSIRMMKAYFY